jgi:FMN phosphatase YigB (HAD superfamily)
MDGKIECIHFDLDSVLYIPSEFLETALIMSVKAMIQTGLRANPHEALNRLKEIRDFDSNAKDHFDRLCLHFNGSYDPIIIAAGIEKYWDCKIGIMTTAPETNLVLSALHQRYPLAIITNGPALKQAGKVVWLGLSHFFSRYDGDLNVQKHFFYAATEPEKTKPYPYLWLRAQEDIGYRFSNAVMVGDRYWDDIFGANRLGMITVKINQGRYSGEPPEEALGQIRESEDAAFFRARHSGEEIRSLMKPHYTIGSLKELEGVVRRIEEGI